MLMINNKEVVKPMINNQEVIKMILNNNVVYEKASTSIPYEITFSRGTEAFFRVSGLTGQPNNFKVTKNVVYNADINNDVSIKAIDGYKINVVYIRDTTTGAGVAYYMGVGTGTYIMGTHFNGSYELTENHRYDVQIVTATV